MSDLVIEPKVVTLARPAAGLLLRVRDFIRDNQTARDLFIAAKADRDADRLARDLETLIGREFPLDSGTEEVARYLSDEYFQLEGGILLISRETGLPIARLTEADFYVPNAVSRGDHFVERAPQLRPEVQGMIVEWVFNNDREKEMLETQAKKLSSLTAIQAPLTSPRLLATTKAGRRQLTSDLQDRLRYLLENPMGAAKVFFDWVQLDLSEDPVLPPFVREFESVNVTIQVPFNLVDSKFRNLQFDIFQAHSATLVIGWVREIVRLWATSMNPAALDALEAVAPDEGDMVLTSADVANLLWGLSPQAVVLPVLHSSDAAIRLRKGAAILKVDPNSLVCSSRERNERWLVDATLRCELWLNHKNVNAVKYENVPLTGVRAEIVPGVGG